MKKNNININIKSLYSIAAVEIGIIFSILFITYTMPMTVYKFSSSFFGKMIIIISIIYASYYKISYGVVLTALFIGISEIGKLEEGFDNLEEGFDNLEEGFDNLEEGSDEKQKNDEKQKDKTLTKELKKTAKDDFLLKQCGSVKTKFDLSTIDKDYPSLNFTDGVCEPCDPRCRYNITESTAEQEQFNKLIKPPVK
jgi:hypothetical protein